MPLISFSLLYVIILKSLFNNLHVVFISQEPIYFLVKYPIIKN